MMDLEKQQPVNYLHCLGSEEADSARRKEKEKERNSEDMFGHQLTLPKTFRSLIDGWMD
jgi:hypothetical protein